MNKKIKIIELFKLISNKKQIPKKVLYENEEYVFNGESFVCCDHDLTPLLSEYNKRRLIDFLNEEVEILEDNIEEIEKLDEEWTYIEGQIEKTWSKSELELVNKINEIIRYIKGKDKNND